MLRGFYPGYPVHPVLSYSRRSRGDPLSHSSSWGKASRIENRGSTIARSKTALDPRRLTFVGRSYPGPSPPLFLDRVGMPSRRLCYSRSWNVVFLTTFHIKNLRWSAFIWVQESFLCVSLEAVS